MMISLAGDAARHYWLTQGMARAVGVNISEAIQAGSLTHEDLAIMVVRCRMCGRADQCSSWLGRNGAGAAALPDYCDNKPDIEALRSPAPAARQGGSRG